MNDLISRSEAVNAMMKLQAEDIEAYGASIPEGFDGDRATAALKALPSVDAVEVVRCAVCTHFRNNMRGDGTLPNGVDEFECRNGRGGCDPMGFCDEGERKDGGNGRS